MFFFVVSLKKFSLTGIAGRQILVCYKSMEQGRFLFLLVSVGAIKVLLNARNKLRNNFVFKLRNKLIILEKSISRFARNLQYGKKFKPYTMRKSHVSVILKRNF